MTTDDVRSWAYAAIEHHEQGRLDEAEPLYRRYLAAVADDPAIAHLFGMLRLQRGDVEEARGWVQHAVATAPEVAEYQMNLGRIHERLGNAELALDAYQAAAREAPDEAALLRPLSRVLVQLGRHEEAARHLEHALHLADDPGIAIELASALEAAGCRDAALCVLQAFCERHEADPHAHHVLGGMALRHGRKDVAERALERAIQLAPHASAPLNDLGALHITNGRLESAVALLSRAVELDSESADAHYNLGNALEKLTRYEEAASAYRKALERKPDHEITSRNLAALYYKTGRREQMAEVLENHLSRRPDDHFARHMLAAARGEPLTGSAPEYVRDLFDRFATAYNERLAGIEYRGPQLLELALEMLNPPVLERVLDAGCGTGLCAPILKPRAHWLIGVDLSPRMLDQARDAGLYDELHESELAAYLNGVEDPFQLITAIDTCVYLGDLAPALAGAAAALAPGGMLIFTVESLSSGDGFTLGPSGRFQHSEAYLRSELSRAALTPVLFEAAHLRLELGKPVEGYVVAAGRRG